MWLQRLIIASCLIFQYIFCSQSFANIHNWFSGKASFIPPYSCSFSPGFQGIHAIEKMAQIYINELKNNSEQNPKQHSQCRPVRCFRGIQIRSLLDSLIKCDRITAVGWSRATWKESIYAHCLLASNVSRSSTKKWNKNWGENIPIINYRCQRANLSRTGLKMSSVVIPRSLWELYLKENELDKDLLSRWWLSDWNFCSKTLLAVIPDDSPSAVLFWLKFQETDPPASHRPSYLCQCR